jgi:hypothetical protein
MPQQPEERMNDPALGALAEALRGLAPRAGGLDRDRLMFRAGRASAPRSWAWPLATAASTAAAVALGVLLWARPEPAPRVVERVVHLPAERPQPAGPEAPGTAPESEASPPLPPDYGGRSPYLRLQEHLLRWGLEGLPAPPEQPEREGPQTVDALLQSL